MSNKRPTVPKRESLPKTVGGQGSIAVPKPGAKGGKKVTVQPLSRPIQARSRDNSPKKKRRAA